MRLASAVRSIALALVFIATLNPGASAQDARADALARLFADEPVQAGWFAPAFLAQVPVPKIEQIRQSLRQYGQLQRIVPTDSGFTLRFDRAEVPAQIVLDPERRISGLFFETPIPRDGVADLAQAIAALPGETSLLVLTDGNASAAHAADVPLAVGSAFKLAVLKALAGQVASGAHAWDEVVPLDPAWRSLPTGILQNWPADTPLTLATLASLMISISDNTATDALLRIVGREAAEAYAPHSRPLLSTREAFTLKADPALAQAWRDGDEAERRKLLERIAAVPLPPVEALPAEPTGDIEWFFTAAELCQLLADTHALPIFAINPGLAAPQDWSSVAYKGGSEVGVLNLSTYLVGKDGSEHCVTATWNDGAPLDEAALATRYRGLLRALADAE